MTGFLFRTVWFYFAIYIFRIVTAIVNSQITEYFYNLFKCF